MIIEFSIENFLSFKDKTTLSMIENPSTAEEHKPFYDPAHTRIINENIKVLPVGAIYGYNATGKSNIVKALKTLKTIVTEKQIPREKSENNPFRFSKTMKEKPSKLTLKFYEKESMEIYTYSVCFNNKEIKKEELIKNNHEKNEVIFKRTLKKENDEIKENTKFDIIINNYHTIYIAKSQKLVKKSKLVFRITNNIPKNKSLLSYDYIKKSTLRNIVTFFEKIIIVNAEEKIQYDTNFLENSNLHLLPKISQFQLGIEQVRISDNGSELPEHLEDVDDADSIEFFKKSLEIVKDDDLIEKLTDMDAEKISNIKYNGITVLATPKLALVFYNEEFYYHDVEYIMKKEVFTGNEISSGTKQLIEYAKLIEMPPENNYIYIIDEIETNLHRNLLKALINNFIENNNMVYEKSKGKSKNLGSQLIFTTHETSLMTQDIMENKNMLRLDEIFHIIKKDDLSSDIRNFSYYKRIENVASALELAYIENKIEKISKPELGKDKTKKTSKPELKKSEIND